MNVLANALSSRTFFELALFGLVITMAIVGVLLVAVRRAARLKIERKPFLTRAEIRFSTICAARCRRITYPARSQWERSDSRSGV